MLRRVARVVRIGLFALGVVLLVWIPCSFYRVVGLNYHNPEWGGDFFIAQGIMSLEHKVTRRYNELGFHPHTGKYGVSTVSRASLRKALWPAQPTGDTLFGTIYSGVRIPLWLLAAFCLAWPVTSAFIYLRRHKRGFPVEPKGSGDSVNTSAS